MLAVVQRSLVKTFMFRVLCSSKSIRVPSIGSFHAIRPNMQSLFTSPLAKNNPTDLANFCQTFVCNPDKFYCFVISLCCQFLRSHWNDTAKGSLILLQACFYLLYELSSREGKVKVYLFLHNEIYCVVFQFSGVFLRKRKHRGGLRRTSKNVCANIGWKFVSGAKGCIARPPQATTENSQLVWDEKFIGLDTRTVRFQLKIILSKLWRHKPPWWKITVQGEDPKRVELWVRVARKLKCSRVLAASALKHLVAWYPLSSEHGESFARIVDIDAPTLLHKFYAKLNFLPLQDYSSDLLHVVRRLWTGIGK